MCSQGKERPDEQIRRPHHSSMKCVFVSQHDDSLSLRTFGIAKQATE